MFNVKTDTVRERTTNGPTYMKGRQYYKHGHVKHIAYDQKNGLIVAQVEGTRMYHVRIILNSQGEIHDATCTCSAFSAYWGYCRHIAAALLHCIDAFNQEQKRSDGVKAIAGRPVQNRPGSQTPKKSSRELVSQNKDKAQMLRRNRSKAKDFLSRMQHVCQLQGATNKKIVNLRVVLYCPRSTSGTPWFSMAVGLGKKLFPITNIEQFAEAISRDLPVELDQSFIYDPAQHTFQEMDKPLINMIQDAFENDYKAVFGTAGSASKDRCFPLNPSRLASFLIFSKQLNDCTWLSHLDEPRSPIEVKQAGLPIRLRLETSHPGSKEDLPPYQLSLVSRQPIHQITSSRNVYLAGDTFHLPPADYIRYIEPLLAAFTKPNVKALYLSHEEAAIMLSEIRPSLERFCPIEIADDVASQIIDAPLSAQVELDYLSTSGLKAAVQFQYDQYTINPMQIKSAVQDDSATRLIVREKEKEDKLVQMLHDAGFSQYGNSLRLNDYDKLFKFIESDLEALAQYAEIRLTPEAKKIKILPPPEIHFQLSKATIQDDLTFKQHYGHLQPGEWPVYVKAVKEGKPYYRRTDGAFQKVDLNRSSFIVDIDHLMSLWQVKASTKTLTLPSYRALALSRFSKQYQNDSWLQISEVLREQITNMNQPGSLRFRTPQILSDKLRPYQKTGYRWLCMLDHYGLGGILADDMGLGKTLQTIAFIHYIWHKYKRNTIIVAPTSLIYNWAAEFEKFAPLLPIGLIDGHPDKRAEIMKNNRRYACLITSYSLLRRDIDDIKAYKFGCCFIDEAQNIKNPDTQNARSVKQIKAERYFALTGTPIENTLTELWSIFDFILPGYLYNHHYFQKYYELPISRENDEEKAENLRLLIAPFLLRRMKKNVLQELPEKIETRTICDMTSHQRFMYEAFLEKSKTDLSRELKQSGYAKSQIYILALLTRLRQICCHPGLFDKHYEGGSGKLLLLDELLSDSFASGHRVLLFSQFTHMLDIIRKRVEASGEKPLYIDGQVPADERVRLVDRFNAGEGRLFLVSLRAGGTGLNLTGADTVIHYDPWWNPAVEEQATDRAYRIGQENVVQVIKLFTRNSVEEKIYRLQEQKQKLADTMIRPGQNLLSKMNVNEVLQLFDLKQAPKHN